MKRFALIFAFLLTLSNAFVSCRDTENRNDDVEESMEEMGDEMEDAAEDVEDEID